MVFPVVMYGCESWTVKKAEHLRIDAFELWLFGCSPSSQLTEHFPSGVLSIPSDMPEPPIIHNFLPFFNSTCLNL